MVDVIVQALVEEACVAQLWRGATECGRAAHGDVDGGSGGGMRAVDVFVQALV